MARITVEDCIDKVINRFELVALAAQRAKQINAGVSVTLERENDKSSVLALREIALGNVKPEILREELISGFQTTIKTEPMEEESMMEAKEEEQDNYDYLPENTDLYSSDSEIDDASIFDDTLDTSNEEDLK